MEPITVIVQGQVTVHYPEVLLDTDTLELLPDGRTKTLVKFFSDCGWRTVELAHITVR